MASSSHQLIAQTYEERLDQWWSTIIANKFQGYYWYKHPDEDYWFRFNEQTQHYKYFFHQEAHPELQDQGFLDDLNYQDVLENQLQLMQYKLNAKWWKWLPPDRATFWQEVDLAPSPQTDQDDIADIAHSDTFVDEDGRTWYKYYQLVKWYAYLDETRTNYKTFAQTRHFQPEDSARELPRQHGEMQEEDDEDLEDDDVDDEESLNEEDMQDDL